MLPRCSDLVVKSNRLVEASYRLNLIEQQIILLAICKARESGIKITASTLVTITAAEFARQFNANETMVYRQLKTAADVLFDRRVLINDTDEKTGKPRKVKTRWVQDVAYVEGAAQIQMTFARKMIPYIDNLEVEFTRYRLDKIGQLSSANAVRLYEILLQRLNMTQPVTLEIEALKEAMQLTDGYQRTDSFKRSVLDKAVKQIKKFTDLNVSYDQIKTGRVITHFAFTIRLKSSGVPTPKSDKKEVTASSTTAPLPFDLPESITAPVVQNKDHPAVKRAQKETLVAARKMRSSVASRPFASDQVIREQLETLGQQRLLPESDVKK
jgi:plasmid replication initiation protein